MMSFKNDEPEFQIHRLCFIFPPYSSMRKGQSFRTMHCHNDFEQKMWQETRKFILNYLAQCVHELTEAGSGRCWGVGGCTVHGRQRGCKYNSIYSDLEYFKVG
jgi:hypothetical protein